MKIEQVWVLGLAVMAASGCEVPGECGEAGVCVDGGEGGDGGGGEGGEGGEGGGGAELTWALILDISEEQSMAGTPGADICGVSSSCGNAISALLVEGEGELCTEIGPDCSAVRTDPDAALDDGSACEAASAPSDYVTLGLAGTLAVEFSQPQSGCTIEVVELVGNQEEGYEVYVCAGADASSGCANNDRPLGGAPSGGSASIQVP